jgi:dipeptidyl aminopeptidase/acylaminoacyl peptidase
MNPWRCCIGLLLYTSALQAQSDITLSPKQPVTSNDTRDALTRYVWSHTHVPAGSKPLLDFDAIDHWPVLPGGRDVSISPDGNYMAYGISKQYQQELDSLVVKTVNNDWQLTFTNAQAGFFAADSHRYIFQQDSVLRIIALGSNEEQAVPNVQSYLLPATADDAAGRHRWLAIRLRNQQVLLRNLVSGWQQTYNDVTNYQFADDGGWLFLQHTTGTLQLGPLADQHEQQFQSVINYAFNNKAQVLLLKRAVAPGDTTLEYHSLPTGHTMRVWQSLNGYSLTAYAMDDAGKQVALVCTNAAQQRSVWYWQPGMDSAVEIINDQSAGIPPTLRLAPSVAFLPNGKYMQLSLQPAPAATRTPDPDAAKVDIHTWRDLAMQPRLFNRNAAVNYMAVLNLDSHQLLVLENQRERVWARQGDYVVVINKHVSDRFWDKQAYTDSSWLVSLRNGRRRYLPATNNTSFYFSPDGTYLVYFNGYTGHFYSYELRTGRLMNITAALPKNRLAWKDPYLHITKPTTLYVIQRQLLGWLAMPEALLVSDGYDIWQLDITGVHAPINLTHGYAQQHGLQLELSGAVPFGSLGVFKQGDTLLLRALNIHNKYNGFYRLVIGAGGGPIPLCMGPYCMERLAVSAGFMGAGMTPVKAADTNVWIVKRESAIEAPNYCVTNNFTQFRPVTRYQPQQAYNWLTAELHSFTLLDGSTGQGVLYKPQNFDATKKYPVIVTFYGRLTDQLYQFPVPEYVTRPSIFEEPAFMVSHGYLVFVPDLHFTQGNWGWSTVNTLEGAAKYLKRLPYVDARGIGAAGHSNSGRFGYYLLTHSRLFAAMALGSGHGGTDLLSIAFSVDAAGWIDELQWAEQGAYGAGGLGNLWTNKAQWLDHIAVLNADKVSSPLLLFHNNKDGDAVRLAIELFMALRRLNKRVWWLQYDEGYHGVYLQPDKRDFTIRYLQFFDHYLKHAPVPRWMEEGINEQAKGVEGRYELKR